MSENRYRGIDVLKGMGILLVVYGHVIRGLIDAQLLNRDGLYHLNQWIYLFHMPIFFFVSGLFLKPSYGDNFWSVIARRSLQLMWPYFLWVTIQGGVLFLASRYANHALTFQDLLKSYLIGPGQFWFLPTLLIYSVGSMLLIRMGVPKWHLFILGIVLLFFPWLGRGGCNFIYFALGCMLGGAAFVRVAAGRVGGIGILIFVTASGGYAYSLWKFLPEVIVVCSAIIIGCFAPFALFNLQQVFKPFLKRCLAYLGEKSLEIYVAHIVFAAGFRVLYFNVLKFDNLPIGIIGGTVCGVLGPLCLSRLAESMRLEWIFRPPFKIVGR